jgi:ParB family chromosome partitioning protein
MTQMIPLAQIKRNPNQPRETFPEEHIARLADSIRKRGLIQAITLRPHPNPVGDVRYMIVAGECRFRAHQLLGRAEIKADIVHVDDAEMQLQAIVENLQRQDMNPIEEARAYQTLVDQGFTATLIVHELGLRSTAIVTQRLSLLNLAPEIQRLVISGQLAVTMAWGVALVSHEKQLQLVRDIASGKLRTAEQVKHAGIAIRDAEAQLDAFAALPKASDKDLATVSRLEHKIEQIVSLTSLGFKDGECVAAQRVAPDRLLTMADKLVLVRKHVLQMEHDLRRVATQSEILFGKRHESTQHTPALRAPDRGRAQAHRKPDVDDTPSRPAADPRSPALARPRPGHAKRRAPVRRAAR